MGPYECAPLPFSPLPLPITFAPLSNDCRNPKSPSHQYRPNPLLSSEMRVCSSALGAYSSALRARPILRGGPIPRQLPRLLGRHRRPIHLNRLRLSHLCRRSLLGPCRRARNLLVRRRLSLFCFHLMAPRLLRLTCFDFGVWNGEVSDFFEIAL
jgi:hypothetical protein